MTESDSGGGGGAELVVNMLSTMSSESQISSVCFYIEHDMPWMLDSGTSDHITPHYDDFLHYNKLATPGTIKLGNDSHMQYLGTGTVTGTSVINGKTVKVTLTNILHAPQAGSRFISIF